MVLERPNTLHFAMNGVSKITDKDVLERIKDIVDKKDIEAIQVTLEECRVTLKTTDSKLKLKHTGINIAGRYISMVDSDKTVTNVTVKDAPVEMDDIAITSALSAHGEIVQSSIKRGKIKGTEIETGTRYLAMTNVEDVIPIDMTIGSFNVRVYCDNNRTRCIHCTLTTHPSYKCPAKPKFEKKCYRCFSTSHISYKCPNDIVCKYCEQSGHKQADCEEMKKEKFGEYWGEIDEANKAESTEDISQLKPTADIAIENENPFDVFSEKLIEETITDALVLGDSNLVQDELKNVIFIGDSNMKNVQFEGENVKVFQKSGATYEHVGEVLEAAVEICGKTVEHVVVHLGTNDMLHNKGGIEDVEISIIEGTRKVQECFPESSIVISGILPKKGRNKNTATFNENVKILNKLLNSICKRTPRLSFIDNTVEFSPNDNIKKKLFSDSDGIQLNESGRKVLENTMIAAIKEETNHKKRERESADTPPSTEKKDKLRKQDQ